MFILRYENFQHNWQIVWKEQTQALFLTFLMVFSTTSVIIQLQFLTAGQHESCTRKKYILVSDRIQYIKKICSQCNLSVEIEPVQDIWYIYICTSKTSLILVYHVLRFTFQIWRNLCAIVFVIRQMSAYLGDHNIAIKLFQKRFVRTKLDFYACITITGSIPPLVDCKSPVISPAQLSMLWHWLELLDIFMIEIYSPKNKAMY